MVHGKKPKRRTASNALPKASEPEGTKNLRLIKIRIHRITRQDLLKAVNHHAVAVDMRINAAKIKITSALIPDEECQAVLLDGETTSARCSTQMARAPKR